MSQPWDIATKDVANNSLDLDENLLTLAGARTYVLGGMACDGTRE